MRYVMLGHPTGSFLIRFQNNEQESVPQLLTEKIIISILQSKMHVAAELSPAVLVVYVH